MKHVFQNCLCVFLHISIGTWIIVELCVLIRLIKPHSVSERYSINYSYRLVIKSTT